MPYFFIVLLLFGFMPGQGQGQTETTTTTAAVTTTAPVTETTTADSNLTTTTMALNGTEESVTAANVTSTVETTTVSEESTTTSGSTSTTTLLLDQSTTIIITTTVEPTTTITAVETTPAPLIMGCNDCRGWLLNSENGSSICLTANDHQLFHCDEAQLIFVPFSAGTVMSITCNGNFNFSILGTNFRINGTSLYKVDAAGTSLSLADWNSGYVNYLARLRPSAGAGTLYCSVSRSTNNDFSDSVSYAFFYNGTSYYDLMVDGSGYLYSQTQSTPHYTYYYQPFITQSIAGCSSPVCCWFEDQYQSSLQVTEYVFNGTKWLVWLNGTYQLYSGDLTQNMWLCVPYFSTFAFTISNGTKYQFFNGSIYQLNSTTRLPAFPVEIDYSQYVDTDPLASGGYYYYTVQDTSLIAMFKNLSGDYLVTVKNGDLSLQRKPPACTPGYASSANSNPSCVATEDVYKTTQMVICDPLQKPSVCGYGYQCVTYPSAFSGGLSCSMGFCIPDYSLACAQQTTLAPGKALQKYGSSCSSGSDCYTGICTSGVCSCTSCTKILPGLDYDWRALSFVYKETCIPNNSSIGSLGDPCNMWADVRAKTCGMGLFCAKCPEVWNSVFANAICIAATLPDPTSASTTCPSTVTCGYKAVCKMVAGVATCTCPAGYNLESNMVDCYGWNVTNSGNCSVTCGNGVRPIVRTCDKATGSKASCDGNSTIFAPCTAGGQCPLPDDMVPAAVLVQIRSKVISEQLFNAYIQTPAKTALVKALNDKCLADSLTFEKQCCPGKAWSSSITVGDCVNSDTGVTFLSKFSDGSAFKFYLVAKGNSTSSCCTKAAVKVTRTRRETSSGNFDQTALSSVVSDPAVTSAFVSSSQSVDPNAAAPSIFIATKTSTQTPLFASTEAQSSSGGGLEVWAIGVIAGVGGGALIIAICVVMFVLYKRKKRMEAKRNKFVNTNAKPAVAPAQEYVDNNAGYRPTLGMREMPGSTVAAAPMNVAYQQQPANNVYLGNGPMAYRPFYAQYYQAVANNQSVLQPVPPAVARQARRY